MKALDKEEKSAAEITVDYIKEHPHIKHCLKSGLINYSALARLISKDLRLEKKASNESLLVAARRYYEILKKERRNDLEIKTLLSDSELEIKNKIVVFILEKNIDLEKIDVLQKKIWADSGLFYLFKGSNNYTIITLERFAKDIEKRLSAKIILKNKNLSLLVLKSPKKIERVRGVVSYLTSLFAENDVNLVEFFSCWTDTIFIISSKDQAKAINFLSF